MSNETINGLNALLCDTMVMYQKLRGYHWNVKGPMFYQLHQQFEELYTQTAVDADDLAERVRALGGRPASTLGEFVEGSSLDEDAGDPSAKEMVQNLIDDMSKLHGALRTEAARAGEKGDQATLNMLEGLADGQEKTMWMLRSFLAE